MNEQESNDTVACTPAGVPAEKRRRWIEVGKQIYGAVEEIQELPDGYACRLPGDAATLLRAAEYVSLDRLCCAFATWELRAESNSGPVWLRITGPEGAKALTRSAFETMDLVSERVLEAAGLRPLERRTPAQVLGDTTQ